MQGIKSVKKQELTFDVKVKVEAFKPKKGYAQPMMIDVKGLRRRFKEDLEWIIENRYKRREQKEVKRILDIYKVKTVDQYVEYLLSQIRVLDLYDSLGIEAFPINLTKYPQFDPNKKQKVEFT
jgi:hypothetical protein